MKKIINSKNLILIGLIGCVICGCASKEPSPLFDTPQTPDFEHDTPVGEITSENTVYQTFISSFNTIDRLELYGATYKRENVGTVRIEIFASDLENIKEAADNDLISVASWDLDVSNFEDNTVITLDAVSNSQVPKLSNKHCMIKISSNDCVPGSAITFWTTQENFYPDGAVNIGGYDQYNDLWFNVYGH